METLNFKIISSKNDGLLMSPSEVLVNFLANIPTNGLSEQQLTNFILGAQEGLEKLLGIKFTKQVISEDRSYLSDELFRYLYLRTSFPVNYPLGLQGHIGQTKVLNYPQNWLKHKSSSTGQYYRQINLVPNGAGNATLASYPYIGGVSSVMLIGADRVPEYWKTIYITGFEPNKIPKDLLLLIGKIAAVDALNIISNGIIGAGLTGTTLSIDGLSQSIQTSKSSGTSAFSAQINQYLQDIKESLIVQKSYYKGITMTCA